MNKARSFIYTTAPSVATCAAVLGALKIIREQPQRRQALNANAEHLRDGLSKLGLNTGQSCCLIIPVIIGSEEDTMKAATELFNRGFFISGIRPPTVAPGTSRLRISVQAGHTSEQINSLIQTLSDLASCGAFRNAR
jgi:7-keto-8-aminopelargonate synthetase-like enzyme